MRPKRRAVKEIIIMKERTAKRSHEMDMCSGPLLGKILIFAIPLMLSSILQLLFNAADIIVVGRFVGHQALAAVGSTSSLINLLINVFIGFSVGTNVMTARYIGSGHTKDISEVVHTSITFSVVCGVVLIFLGFFLSKPLLELMGTPDDVLDQAALYMKVYFSGMPIIMLYNFGTAIFRAIGDTRRPLYYLAAAGALNIIMNVIFVTQFGMGVEGVALATVLSQILSSGLVVRALVKAEGPYKLHLKKLGINRRKIVQIMKIGLPAGMQGAIFSVSNVLIQSSINLFGSVAMAGNTAASNIEGFVYTAMNSFHQTAISFTGQNYGAGKLDRVKRIMWLCVACVTVTGVVLGISAYLFGHQLLGIYSSDAEVIEYGIMRLSLVCAPYFLCGLMDVMVGCLRGLGYSFMPMVVSLAGACGLRIVWIFTVFRWNQTLPTLYFSYPFTWAVTFACHFICFFILFKKLEAMYRK